MDQRLKQTRFAEESGLEYTRMAKILKHDRYDQCMSVPTSSHAGRWRGNWDKDSPKVVNRTYLHVAIDIFVSTSN
jgi:hypothetical protein